MTVSTSVEQAERDRKWYVLDAANTPMGRLAAEAAKLLRGKHKPTFTPHIDTGDYVIIINADKVALTGLSKGSENVYHHTGWPGALNSVRRQQELDKRPDEAIRRVIRGMIPHNKLGDSIIKKLKVYRGPEHPHQAQSPIEFTDARQMAAAKAEGEN